MNIFLMPSVWSGEDKSGIKLCEIAKKCDEIKAFCELNAQSLSKFKTGVPDTFQFKNSLHFM